MREKYDTISKQISIPETAKEIIYLKASKNSPIELANKQHKIYVWKIFVATTSPSMEKVNNDKKE